MTHAPSPLGPSTDAALPSPALAPVTQRARLASVDTLRGFALLGILAMNIVSFALPSAAYMNPTAPGLVSYQGEFTGLNRIVWWVGYLFFDQKMMATFSMLFGAGLVLMGGRAQEQAGPEARAGFAGVYYRRLLWLFLIGMAHAYLLWFGDILVGYALCGLLLYPLRRVRPVWLISIGTAVVLVAVPMSALMGGLMTLLERMATDAQSAISAGKTPTSDQLETLESYTDMMADFDPTPEQAAETVATMRGSYGEILRANAASTVMFQTMIFFMWTLWRGAGLMLIGMGLMKLGVFGASRPSRSYVRMALIGYGVGLPIVATGALMLFEHRFDPKWMFLVDGQFNYLGSIPVALGHVAVVMLVCQSGALPWLRARLAAVGQMALTNYLMHTLLCTFIFYGWGLGYFATIGRAPLMLVVAGIWLVQLVYSPLWLARFRFGPAEWAWRSLTYWKRQPMLRRSLLSEPVA